MVVITVAQGKGGVGKTTLAVNLAGEIAQSGHSVTLVDADPQGSATQWAEPRRLPFPVRHEIPAPRSQLGWVRDVLKLSDDVVMIDTPGGYGPAFETAVFVADIVLVPCGPSSLDIGEAAATVERVRKIRREDKIRSKVQIALVPTRVDPATEEGRQIGAELEELGELVAPSLSYDVEFVRSFASGLSVSAVDRASSAAEEVRTLWRFLSQRMMRAPPKARPFAPGPSIAR